MAGLGFFAGGFSGGLANGRQAALELAHQKMQMQQMQWQQQKFAEQQAVQPLEKILNPYNAGEVMPGISEAQNFAKQGESYSYQPQPIVPSSNVPTEVTNVEDIPGAITGSLAREANPTVQPPAQTGRAGYGAMLGDVGRSAQEAQLDRETRMLKNAILRAQSMYGFRTQSALDVATGKEKLKDEHDPARAAAVADALVGPKARTAAAVAEAQIPSKVETARQVEPIKTEEAGKRAAATATAREEAKVAVKKPANVKDAQGVRGLVELRNRTASIQDAIDRGEFPDTGTGLSKLNETAERVGGYLPDFLKPKNRSLDDPRVTAAYKTLEELRLDIERAKGGVRMAASPQMLSATSKIFANPQNSPGGLKARIHNAVDNLNRVIEDELGGLEANNVDVTELRSYANAQNRMPPSSLLGGGDPYAKPQGVFNMFGINPFPASKSGKKSPAPGQIPARPPTQYPPQQPFDIPLQKFDEGTGTWR